MLFPDAPVHPRIGRWNACFAGHVCEGEYRSAGSSGGFGTWILAELLRRGIVDAVVHVAGRTPTREDPALMAYTVSRTAEQALVGAKSRYYPVAMNGVLDEIRRTPGRYALVGLPCFLKAVRLLQAAEPLFAERITHTIGLFCGHLKTRHYADWLAWQCGIEPGSLGHIDFRTKTQGRADAYGVTARDMEDHVHTRPVRDFDGTDWGLGYFKYPACDYCDDVTGETADIAVGDAWLPRYVRRPEGTNALIVRRAELLPFFEEARSQGRIKLEPLSADDVARSQAAGLFHRREGLAYRLHLAEAAGRWHPPKRVGASEYHLSPREQRKHALRPELTARSHEAFQKALQEARPEAFIEEMAGLVVQYRKVQDGAFDNLKKILKNWLRPLK
jgi:coenzyme F420-reducing hydrogenase beta subunit